MNARSAHPVDIYVGKMICRFRAQTGHSQVQLAERIGVTFQQLQKYEKGTNRVSASRLWELSKALDRPLTDFFPAQDGVHNAPENDAEFIRWARIFHSVPDDRRVPLLKTVRTIVSELIKKH